MQQIKHAIVAQLVEHDLAKVGVAGSNPVYRLKAPEINVSGVLLCPEIRLVLVGIRFLFTMPLKSVSEWKCSRGFPLGNKSLNLLISLSDNGFLFLQIGSVVGVVLLIDISGMP